MSALSGVFSLESPTRRMNLPGSMVHLCADFVPIAEGARIELERHVLGFAGSEADLRKSLQLALGPVNLRGGVGDIKLRDFGSGHAAGVGDVEADRNRGAGSGGSAALQDSRI